MPLVDLTSNTFTFTVESERSGASFLFVRSERSGRASDEVARGLRLAGTLNTEDEGLCRKSNDRRSSVASYRPVVLHSFRSKLSFRGFRQQDRVIKIPAMKLFTIRVRNNFYLCSQVPEVTISSNNTVLLGAVCRCLSEQRFVIYDNSSPNQSFSSSTNDVLTKRNPCFGSNYNNQMCNSKAEPKLRFTCRN